MPARQLRALGLYEQCFPNKVFPTITGAIVNGVVSASVEMQNPSIGGIFQALLP
jgi:hypothetical protein